MEYSTVKWFDPKKGYGFIHHPDDGEDVFVHYSNINSDDDFKTLRTDQSVRFEMNDGPEGPHALNVIPTDEEKADAPSTVENDDEMPEIDPSEVDPTAEVDPSPMS